MGYPPGVPTTSWNSYFRDEEDGPPESMDYDKSKELSWFNVERTRPNSGQNTKDTNSYTAQKHLIIIDCNNKNSC
jgi:hypothetical protein